MSASIVRCGPYANSDRPYIGFGDVETFASLPVNAADLHLDGVWPWRWRNSDERAVFLTAPSNGEVIIFESVTEVDPIINYFLVFGYQAKEEWALENLNYFAFLEQGGVAEIRIELIEFGDNDDVIFGGTVVDTLFTDIDDTTASGENAAILGESVEVNFPPADKPKFIRIFISATGEGPIREATVNLSFNLRTANTPAP
jgi:hypothetical protein